MMFPDTIFALASGALPSAVAIIRISGSRVRFALETILGRVPPPRQVVFGSLRDAEGGLLDRGLALYFEGPHSATGEDCGELHVHGGPAVVQSVLMALGRLEGLRPAEAGDFTRRAFLNGRMDLTEVESLGDLLAAETETQRQLALTGARGANRALYEEWRRRILHLRAHVEAQLDFSDQDDVDGAALTGLADSIAELCRDMAAHAARYSEAEIVRRGFHVALIGAPNAGKSSLLNALAGRPAAIVSDEPGTTRDVIEVSLDLGGVKVRVSDTAGIRTAAGAVERLGIERATEVAADADLVLLLMDSAAPIAVGLPMSGNAVLVHTKADLVRESGLAVSALTGEGLDRLKDLIAEHASSRVRTTQDPLPFRLRHVTGINRAVDHLRAAAQIGSDDLVAEELRLATIALGEITGHIGAEDILGEIFATFCIGK